MLTFTDRVVMISGANRGIGLAIAKCLHADGAAVSLGARNVQALAQATADMGDDRVLHHQYDATEAGSDRAWLDATLKRFQKLDGLVNCAGILESLTLESDDDSALDRMLDVNVKGPYRLTKLALPHPPILTRTPSSNPTTWPNSSAPSCGSRTMLRSLN